MFITAVSVRGFADLALFELQDLGRRVELRGPDPASTALGDAIELAFAALSEDALARLLSRWGLLGPGEEAEINGENFPDQATWSDGQAARYLLPPGPERHIQVEVEIEPDPILYGELRAESAREPRLVIGLSEGGRLTLGVGVLFASSFDALALNLQRFEVGGQAFPLHGSDRPSWLDRFLRLLAHRFHRHDPSRSVADDALAAATSRDQFEAYQSWQKCIDGEHTLRAARGAGDRSLILCNERPLSRWGPTTESLVRLGASVHLSGADVVWAETLPERMESAIEGDGSALEQVFCIHSEGTIRVESTAEPDPPPLGVTSKPRG
jgi:hypothetical protein